MDIKNELLIRDSRPYVLWRRVSTKKQGKSELGLEAQLTIAKIFTKKEPVEVFTDVWSGTKLQECKGLWSAIKYCQDNDYLLVIAKTDRFRNVRQALEVLETVGEGNLAFCDMPTVNKFILTIMFAVWESQAMMGRVNTKLALDERQRQIDEHGGFRSKAGNWCTHLGHAPGSDTSKMRAAAYASKTEKSDEWFYSSPGIKWVKRQVLRGRSRKDILEEFNENFEMGVEGFCTRTGRPLNFARLGEWIKRLGLK